MMGYRRHGRAVDGKDGSEECEVLGVNYFVRAASIILASLTTQVPLVDFS